MPLKASYIVAGVAVLAIGGWFVVNSGSAERDVFADVEERAQVQAVLPTVVTRTVAAELHPIRLTAYGRTEPNRMVQIKAKTPGAIAATPIAEGAFVRAGTVVCRQDIDARRANVDQARAQLEKALGDLRATEALVEQGYRSSTSLPRDRAAVDAARAQVKSAEIELDNVNLRAPFDAVYERRLAEVGDYLAPGQPCATLVELDPLKLETELTETQVGNVEQGQDVQVRLATGQDVTGRVQFIESVANPSTRTFRMVTQLPNPGRELKAGVSATIGLQTGEAMASLVPSSILTLSEDGETGVRYVDRDDIVRFARTTQVDESPNGLWVTGLPEVARIIVEGQDYVSIGSEVQVRTEASLPDAGGSLAASEFE